jgi:hypothetical protein
MFEFVCMASIWFLFGGWTMPCLFLVYHLFHKCDILCASLFLIATKSSISIMLSEHQMLQSFHFESIGFALYNLHIYAIESYVLYEAISLMFV